MIAAIAFAGGVVFAAGLIVSQMVNPAKVLGFLDLSGSWDPTLALVFAGGLAVAVPGVQWVVRRPRPVFANSFSLPETSTLDRPLVIGSALFGVGWGLAGLCPGPAVTALGSGALQAVIFVAAMITGMIGYRLIDKWRTSLTDG